MKERPPRWALTSSLNVLGAALTATATVVFLVTKFVEGAWVVTIAIPLLMLLFWRMSVYYDLASAQIGVGVIPGPIHPKPSLVLVPIVNITRMAALALAAADGLGDEVLAVSVQHSEADAEAFQAQWDAWAPGVALKTMIDNRRTLAGPLISYVRSVEDAGGRQITVLIPEVRPHKRRHELLHNQRGRLLSALLRQRTDAIVATMPFRLHD